MNVIEWIKQGNIFESGCQALVNPVNCRGKMGKGLALEFKHRYPDMFDSYSIACHNHDVRPGWVLPYLDRATDTWIINFPTKDDWRDPSKMGYIVAGLNDLRDFVFYEKIHSIAIPALGCGLGNLKWIDVQAAIENWFDYEFRIRYDIVVKVYEPKE